MHVDTPYPSFARLLNYPLSVPPLRAFAGLIDDRRGTAAHCAALTARILKGGIPELNVPNSAPWYGPSTLYLELARQSRMRTYANAESAEATIKSIADIEGAESSFEIMLRGGDSAVEVLNESSATAGKNLACQKCIAAGVVGNPSDVRMTQKNLARVLLRDSWIGRPARLARLMM